MRLARLPDGGTTVALEAGHGFVDVHAEVADFARHDARAAAVVREHLPHRASGWGQLIDDWERVREPLVALVSWAESDGRAGPPGEVAPPPLPSEAAGIFAIGANFATHAAQSQFAIDGGGERVEARIAALLENRRSGVPPWGFTILPRTVAGPGEPIGRPPGAELLDYEGEVGAVLRRAHAGVSVWGVAAFHDVSVRDPHLKVGRRIDEGPITWVLQKNFRGGSAFGPWVVVDEGLDEHDLEIVTRVNGEVRQRGNTSEMVYGFADVIDYLDVCVPLRSGDVIASGTPAGTAFESGLDGAYLRDGDLVEIDVRRIGVLANRVVPAPQDAAGQTETAGTGAAQ